MRRKRKRVLVVTFGRPPPSIIRDMQALSLHCDVKTIDYVFQKDKPTESVRTMLSLLRGAVWADVIIAMFAAINAVWSIRFAHLFLKKSIVIVGGYEVACIPEISYGSPLDPTGLKIVKYALSKANLVLTVDESLKADAIRNVGVKGSNIRTVPTGYDYNIFKPSGEKEEIVLTVGQMTEVGEEGSPRKGISTFIETGRLMPNQRFIVAGGISENGRKKFAENAPKNVMFTGFVSDEELLRLYQRAKVYCQLSMYEGLPNALCEAMLCECVPVGTAVCGIPSAIGDTGFYVPYGDAVATAKAIELAMRSENGPRARERIKSLFSIQRRGELLRDAVESLFR